MSDRKSLILPGLIAVTLIAASAVYFLRPSESVASPALEKGRIELIDAPHAVLAFCRTCDEQQIYCLFNMDVIEHVVPCNRYSHMLLGRHATVQEHGVTLGVNGFCLLAV